MGEVANGLALAIRALSKADKAEIVDYILKDPDFREIIAHRLTERLIEPVSTQGDKYHSRSGNGLQSNVTFKGRARQLRESYILELWERGIRIDQVDNVWAKTPDGLWVAIPFATERRPDRWFLGLPENEVLARIRSGGIVVVLLCQSASGSTLDFILPQSKIQEIVGMLSCSGGQLKFNLKKVINRYHLVLPGRGSLDVSDYRGNWP